MKLVRSSGAPRKQRLELLALLILIPVAGWLWSAPLRTEHFLSHASIKELQAYTKEHPGNPHAFYFLGEQFRKKGQTVPAYEAFSHAAGLDTGDEKAWLAWADAAGVANSEQETFSILNRFLQVNPRSARAHFALAQLYQQNHAHKRAYEEALTAAKLDSKDAEAWRTAAVEAMAWNHVTEAVEQASRAVAANPNDWRGYKTLGDAQQALKHNVRAQAAYQQAVTLAPTSAIAHLALGRMLLLGAATPQEIEAARQSLQRASQLDATIPVTFLLLGQAEGRLSHWPEARTALQEAERLDPNNPDVAFELARVYRQAGDSVAAARAVRRHEALRNYAAQKYTLVSRIESRPDEGSLRLQMARLCASHNEYSEAVYYYRSLIARNPQNASVRQEFAGLQASHEIGNLRTADSLTLQEQGNSLLAQKRYAEAKTAYVTLLARDPKSALAYQGIGLALDGQGKDEAFYFLNHAVQIDPQLPEAQFVLGEMFNEAGFSEEATRRLQIAIGINPKRADYWRTLGRSYSTRTYTYVQAEDAFRHSVTLAPEEALNFLELAEMELENHKQAQAEADARRALALSPNDEETISRVGGLLLAAHTAPDAGRQEAESLLRKALDKDPSDDVARYNLGRLALERGDAHQAVSYLEGIVLRSPNAGDVWYALARAYSRLGDTRRATLARTTSQTIHDEYQGILRTEEIVRTRTNDSGLHLKLARLNARRGENAKAINQYQLYLHLKPEDVAVKKELAELEKRLKSEGRLPSMTLFDAMIVSLNHKR